MMQGSNNKNDNFSKPYTVFVMHCAAIRVFFFTYQNTIKDDQMSCNGSQEALLTQRNEDCKILDFGKVIWVKFRLGKPVRCANTQVRHASSTFSAIFVLCALRQASALRHYPGVPRREKLHSTAPFSFFHLKYRISTLFSHSLGTNEVYNTNDPLYTFDFNYFIQKTNFLKFTFAHQGLEYQQGKGFLNRGLLI